MMYRLLKIIPVFVLTVLLVQCTVRTVKVESHFDTVNYEYRGLQPAEFQKEIEWLKARAQEPQGANSSMTHLRLAFLYSHYRNPVPEYGKALEHLRTYESIGPKSGGNGFVQNWLGMLKEIARLGASNQESREKAEQLKKEIARIEKENAEAKEKLEKLKYIDIELEQKRKSVK